MKSELNLQLLHEEHQQVNDIEMTESLGFQDYVQTSKCNQKYKLAAEGAKYCCYQCGGQKMTITNCPTCKGSKYVSDNNVLAGLLLQVMCFMVGKEVHIIKKFPVLEFSTCNRTQHSQNLIRKDKNRGSWQEKKNKFANSKKQYFSQSNSINDSNSLDSSLESFETNNNVEINKNIKIVQNTKNINYSCNQQIQEIQEESYVTEDRILICDVCHRQGEVSSEYLQCKKCKYFFVCLKCYEQRKKEEEKRMNNEKKIGILEPKHLENDQIEQLITLQSTQPLFSKVSMHKKTKQLDDNDQYQKQKQIFHDENSNILKNDYNQTNHKQKTPLTKKSCQFTPPKLQIQNDSIQFSVQKNNKDYFIHEHPLTRYMSSNQDENKQKQNRQETANIMEEIEILESKSNSMVESNEIFEHAHTEFEEMDNYHQCGFVNNKYNIRVDQSKEKKNTLQRSNTDNAGKDKQKNEQFKNLFKVYETASDDKPNIQIDSNISSPVQTKSKPKVFTKQQKHNLNKIQIIKQQRQSPFSSQKSGYVSPKSLTMEKKTSLDQVLNNHNLELRKGPSQNSSTENKVQFGEYQKYRRKLNAEKDEDSQQQSKYSGFYSSSQFQQNIKMTINNNKQSPQSCKNNQDLRRQYLQKNKIQSITNQQHYHYINTDAFESAKEQSPLKRKQNTDRLQQSQFPNKILRRPSEISSQSSIPHKTHPFSSQNSSFISPSAIPSSIPTKYSKQVHPSSLQNIDSKHCSSCLTQITNRSMYMKCQTCQKNHSTLYLLCASCHNSNQVINRHNAGSSVKHYFRAYLHRILSDIVSAMGENQGEEEEEEERDNWMSETTININNKNKQSRKCYKNTNLPTKKIMNKSQLQKKQTYHNINTKKTNNRPLTYKNHIDNLILSQSPTFYIPPKINCDFSMTLSKTSNFNDSSQRMENSQQNTQNKQKSSLSNTIKDENDNKKNIKKQVNFADSFTMTNTYENNSTQLQTKPSNSPKQHQNLHKSQQNHINPINPPTSIQQTKISQQSSSPENNQDSYFSFSYYDYNSEESINKRKKQYENNMKYQLIFERAFNMTTELKSSFNVTPETQTAIDNHQISHNKKQLTPNSSSMVPQQNKPQKSSEIQTQNSSQIPAGDVVFSHHLESCITSLNRKSIGEVINGHWLSEEEELHSASAKIPDNRVVVTDNQKDNRQNDYGNKQKKQQSESIDISMNTNEIPIQNILKNILWVDYSNSKTNQQQTIAQQKNKQNAMITNNNAKIQQIGEKQQNSLNLNRTEQNAYYCNKIVNKSKESHIAFKSRKTISSLSSRIKISYEQSSSNQSSNDHYREMKLSNKKYQRNCQNINKKCQDEISDLKMKQNEPYDIPQRDLNTIHNNQINTPTTNISNKPKTNNKKCVGDTEQTPERGLCQQSNKIMKETDMKHDKCRKKQNGKKQKQKEKEKQKVTEKQGICCKVKGEQELSDGQQSESQLQLNSELISKQKSYQLESRNNSITVSQKKYTSKRSNKVTHERYREHYKGNEHIRVEHELTINQKNPQKIKVEDMPTKTTNQKNQLKEASPHNQPIQNKSKVHYNRQQQQKQQGRPQQMQQAFIFEQYKCDLCQQIPVNYRYHCTICTDYDICSQCYKKCQCIHEHSPNQFEKIDREKELQLQKQQKMKQEQEALKRNDILMAIIKQFLPGFHREEATGNSNKGSTRLDLKKKTRNTLHGRNTETNYHGFQEGNKTQEEGSQSGRAIDNDKIYQCKENFIM